MKEVAAAAGVSAMAVSLALRNRPGTSEATRQHIQAVAKKLGYRPDPEMAKLLYRMRMRQRPQYQATLAAFTTIAEGTFPHYVKEIFDGARVRAEELGYGLSVFTAPDSGSPRRDLERILISRGIEGILVLPLTTPRSLESLLDWQKFSVVSTSYSFIAPEFERVAPFHFANMLLVCRELLRRGYRRIGLVVSAADDERLNHGLSGGIAWHNLLGEAEAVRPLLRPISDGASAKAWYRREKPDVIIGTSDLACETIAKILGLTIPGPIGMVNVGKDRVSIISGLDQNAARIGAIAVNRLAGLIQRRERGPATEPEVTMVVGRWLSGKTVRAVSAASERP